MNRTRSIPRLALLGLCTALVLAHLFVLAPAASAHGAVDQQSLVTGNLFPSSTLRGQSFVPLVNNITGIDISINPASDVEPPFDLTVEVRLRWSDQLIVEDRRLVDVGVQHFDFDETPITPGVKHYFRIINHSGGVLRYDGNEFQNPNPYPHGASVSSSDREDGSFDFYFSTYYTDSLDDDGDGSDDESDMCPGTPTRHPVDNGCSDSQVDPDGDGLRSPGAPSGGPSGATGTDNCPAVTNPGQHDSDSDSLGDACDPDNVFLQQQQTDSGANPQYPWGQVFTATTDDVAAIELPFCFFRVLSGNATVELKEWPSGPVLATASRVELSHERPTIVGFPNGPVGLEIGKQYAFLVTADSGSGCKPRVELFLPGGGRFVHGGTFDTARDLMFRLFTSPGYDVGAPTSTIAFPAVGAAYTAATWDAGGGTPTGDISGTASDGDGAGVQEVEVSVRQDSTGLYWDGSAFAATSEVFSDATGTTSWSLPFPASDFPADGSYTVHARATDTLGHVESGPTAVITIDTTAPTSTIAFPADGSTYTEVTWDAGGDTPAGDISGRAGDGAGVDRVEVSVRQNGTGHYWDGSDFAATSPSFHAATGAADWSLPFAATNFSAGGSYTVETRATDGLGNVEAGPPATFSIVLDTSAPVVVPDVTPEPNAYGWNAGDVDVSWSVTDAESDITSSDGCDPVSLTEETDGTTLTCSAVNSVGLSSTVSVTVKIDETAPVVTPAAAKADATEYAAGTWTNQDVTVDFACLDGGPVQSGLTASAVTGATVSTEGAAHEVTSVGECADAAGNTAAAATFGPIRIDKTPPALTIQSLTAPADGFMSAQTFSAFPAVVGAAPVNVSGTAADGGSGVAAVGVNGTATSGTSSWSKTGVALPGDGDTATVVATDEAGNTTSRLAATLDLDRDGDGIDNDVDGNSTVSPAVSQALTPSSRFSDKRLGGTTSGQLVRPLPAGMTVSVHDAPGAGVRAVVTGGPTQRARLTLDGKAGTMRLAPGAYVLTDPPTITVEVVDGLAEIDYVVNGATVRVAVPEGSTAAITESVGTTGALVGLVVSQTGGTAPVTVNGTPVGSASLAATLSLSSSRLVLDATLTLGAGGATTLPEPVVLRIGTWSATLPASSFRVNSRGQYVATATANGVSLEAMLSRLSASQYRVQVTGRGAHGIAFVNPVTVGVSIGDDTGVAVVQAQPLSSK